MSLAATVEVQLLSNIEAPVCRGEFVTFTCTVKNGAHLRWVSEPQICTQHPITYLPSDSVGRVVVRGNVSANLTSIQIVQPLTANMTSTLTLPVWNDTEVRCENQSLSAYMNVSGEWCLSLFVLLVYVVLVHLSTRSCHPETKWNIQKNGTECTTDRLHTNCKKTSAKQFLS